MSWEREVWDDDGDFEAGWEFEADGAGHTAGIDGAGDDGAEDAGGDVIGMAFDAGGFVEDPVVLPAEAQHDVGEDDAGGEGCGAGAEAFAEGNVVVDFELNWWHGFAGMLGYGERGLPDEIVFGCGDQVCVSAGGSDREFVCEAEAAIEIGGEGEAQGVEAGA